MVENKIEKANHITVQDGSGNKFFVHGRIGGFSLKRATEKRRSAVIVGLDDNWIGKKVLCILVEENAKK